MEKTLLIKKLSEKGRGIAFDENRNKIEVLNAIDGDEVLAELSKKRKNLIKAKILKLLTPSKKRVLPKCEQTEICGGCSYQTLNYLEQLKHKELLIIENIFGDILKNSDVKVYPITPCVEIFEYRNKMEFSFSQNRKGTKYLGLMIKGKQKFVFNVERCHLVSEWYSQILKKVRLWWEKYDFSAFNIFDQKGFLRNLTVRQTKNLKDKMVILTTSDEYKLNDNETLDFVDFIKSTVNEDETVSIFLVTQIAKKGQPTNFDLKKLLGKDSMMETLDIPFKDKTISLNFKIGPFSFFQPNPKQAQVIYSQALKYFDDEDLKDKVVYDLYAGTGTLGMIFSKILAKKVIAIELNQEAALLAKENAILNDIQNFEMVNQDVKKALDDIILNENFEKPYLVVVDPPRAGLGLQPIENIVKLSPKYILYISCNPLTQKDDIEVFSNHNYQLKILHPIDQFPHTYHVENIAILKKLDFE
ncbi:MAG: 23S rRNA (uracil(1939)-C(5))-methyltransferase RlmD [Parachlamydiales bacterium]|nr:23S rRNA (uracil(1939)-C(5))-methyltransferase RlmD [Parachlamydiales bacterium]